MLRLRATNCGVGINFQYGTSNGAIYLALVQCSSYPIVIRSAINVYLIHLAYLVMHAYVQSFLTFQFMFLSCYFNDYIVKVTGLAILYV